MFVPLTFAATSGASTVPPSVAVAESAPSSRRASGNAVRRSRADGASITNAPPSSRVAKFERTRGSIEVCGEHRRPEGWNFDTGRGGAADELWLRERAQERHRRVEWSA